MVEDDCEALESGNGERKRTRIIEIKRFVDWIRFAMGKSFCEMDTIFSLEVNLRQFYIVFKRLL